MLIFFQEKENETALDDIIQIASQKMESMKDHMFLVCNFTPPTKQNLRSNNEVTTLFTNLVTPYTEC
jgi:Zn-dependent oligopeptidase